VGVTSGRKGETMKLFESFHSNEWNAQVANVPDDMGGNRYYLIGDEIVEYEETTARTGTAATIHFRRGVGYTIPACHLAGAHFSSIPSFNLFWLVLKNIHEREETPAAGRVRR
jgi:hypothetical protein